VNYLNQLVTKKSSWYLLALSALALELTALYFQYGMDLAPCIMCIYQRVAILAILAAGLIGGIGNNLVPARLISFALWGTGAIWGLKLALEHVEMQTSDSLFFVCESIPNFPSWFQVHQWFPAVFEAYGDCGEISWQFLGYSMPQWMVVVYGLYSLAFAAILSSRVIKERKI
jgi:disulfide bond formation protein DsbB